MFKQPAEARVEFRDFDSKYAAGSTSQSRERVLLIAKNKEKSSLEDVSFSFSFEARFGTVVFSRAINYSLYFSRRFRQTKKSVG